MENIQISGQQTQLGESLKSHVRENILSSLMKYFTSVISTNVQFSKDTFNFKCEIKIHVEKTIFVQSHALSNIGTFFVGRLCPLMASMAHWESERNITGLSEGTWSSV